jgi:uracil-DNA glycosylase
MKCEEFEQLIVLAQEEDLSARDREDLRDHARACPRCAEFAQDMRAVTHLLQRNRPQAPPPGFEQSVMARIRLVQSAGGVSASWEIELGD